MAPAEARREHRGSGVPGATRVPGGELGGAVSVAAGEDSVRGKRRGGWVSNSRPQAASRGQQNLSLRGDNTAIHTGELTSCK